MTNPLRIVLAQLNLKIGDLAGNLEKHLQAAITARDEHNADIIVFPELSLTAYSCEDLFLRPAFIADTQQMLNKFIASIQGIHCVIGHPHLENEKLYNACSLIYNGSVKARYYKQCLPNYGVFDENRYFTAGESNCITVINDIPVGLLICEDLWRISPAKNLAHEGAKLILAPNASPFETDKHEQRLNVLAKRCKTHRIPIIYVNQVGGQDELVFDGGSMVINSQGELSQFSGFFAEKLLPIDINFNPQPQIAIASAPIPNHLTRIYQALVLSLRDYVYKNNFSSVILGLSGGIDSALTATIAADAIGKDKVHAVIMPSRYTEQLSLDEAADLVQRLGIQAQTISIDSSYQNFLDSLANNFKNSSVDVTEQNIQARCRAIILMALSNKFGHLVLTTGNRSELAVGYCTLYGDMAGGFSVLKDIPKTLVYELANYRNQISDVIPQRTITRPPSAELAPNQKDEDTLPPYAVLDKILEYYLNKSLAIDEIVAKGFDRDTVIKVVNMIRTSQYKRKQSTIGPHINHKSFGKDWRYPITNGFKG